METPRATNRPLTLTPRQAAYELGVSRSYLYRLIKAGDIPVAIVGKSIRIIWTDLVAYVEAARIGRGDA
jgi:excisionase family DNA binding protein